MAGRLSTWHVETSPPCSRCHVNNVYLLLSAAIDFDVTQAVDITKGVHGLIDLSMFQ